MPKRTNPFQTLVYRIQQALHGECRVDDSRFLTDRVLGTEREVDIVIETKLGTHILLLSIECIAPSRKANIEWVERMVGKHANLPTNQLLLVSKRGFTRNALAKAVSSGAKPLVLEDALRLDWTEIVGKLSEVYLATYRFATTSFSVQLADQGDTWYPLDANQVITAHEGTYTTGQLATRLLNDVKVATPIMDAVNRDGSAAATYEFTFPSGHNSRDSAGNPHTLVRAIIAFSITRETAPVPLAHATWDTVPVAHGSATTPYGPTDLTVVEHPGEVGGIIHFVDPQSGTAKTVRLRPPFSGPGGPAVTVHPMELLGPEQQ